MTKKTSVPRIESGVPNLDALFRGGVPSGSVLVVVGPPGAGKTILAQQICFHNASKERPVVYFNTLSEPTAKTLRYLSQFEFFDAKKIENGMEFVDLGTILRSKGLEEASRLIMQGVRRSKPAIVVIDSFRVFDDLATSHAELRKFGYELAVNLMAWETTTFLLGEYSARDLESKPLFSIIDGLMLVTQREESGEQQRFLQILKMRGTEHSRDEHSFVITASGVEVFAPRVAIPREDRRPGPTRCKTGISRLDELLGEGIPRGSSLLVAGVAGTGKTVLLLEFLYRGAKAGERGIMFSFEETPERLRATAHGLGWDLDHEIERGMIEIVFIPQPAIQVEAQILMMRDRVEAMQARRVAVDSVSVFLHKVRDPQIDREKTFQLASIIQNAQSVGLFATDIPYGANQLSRFGVEETVVDGVILLTSTEEGLERERYIEVYKLRNTAHHKGRHSMTIGDGGITIFPRYRLDDAASEAPLPLDTARRIASGVPGLDALLGGGLLERSVTLVSGSAGIGKSTLGLQFILEGAKQGEPGLYVGLEEAPAQLLASADALGVSLDGPSKGLIELMYLPRHNFRASQFLTLLDDRIRAQQTRRVVLDSVTQMTKHAEVSRDLREVLYALAVRFKSLGVTSIFTLESSSLFATDTITERGYSPIVDNIVMLRYGSTPGELRPTLAVIKTRGSLHDLGTYECAIARGGIRIGDRTDAPQAAASESPAVKRGRRR